MIKEVYVGDWQTLYVLTEEGRLYCVKKAYLGKDSEWVEITNLAPTAP